MKTTIMILVLALTTPVLADEANWHLVTKSYGGTVSLIKGLTKKECEEMRHHIGGWWDLPPGTYDLGRGSIESAECFE